MTMDKVSIEEAIKTIEELIMPCTPDSKYYQVGKMAIEALKQEPKTDTLTVTFDSRPDDEAGICVAREVDGKVVVLKMESGEQADILYRLLTEQMTKATITESFEQYKLGKRKAESEDKG